MKSKTLKLPDSVEAMANWISNSNDVNTLMGKAMTDEADSFHERMTKCTKELEQEQFDGYTLMEHDIQSRQQSKATTFNDMDEDPRTAHIFAEEYFSTEKASADRDRMMAEDKDEDDPKNVSDNAHEQFNSPNYDNVSYGVGAAIDAVKHLFFKK